MRMPNIGAIEEPKFLILGNKKVFNQLKLAFTKALIFQNFDLEFHIWIEINISRYAINRILG